MLLFQTVLNAAYGQLSLKGVVTDPDGKPLPGASVVLKNSYHGVSAGTDGTFKLHPLKPGEYSLAVSFIGYETWEKVIFLQADTDIRVELTASVLLTEEILVMATRAHEKIPVAYSNLSSELLRERNLGQDLPYLLSTSPSFVATSDAGNGIGYTSFRIRGTDMNRINVTVNGIPLNDAESHTTFFVDQPDLASSGDNIQIQRGVGTSANGGAAFGATINMQTLSLNPEPYGSVHSSAGSFHSFKNTVAAGTGLINNKFSLDMRLSKISSDGFIDRAFSNLKSYFLSGGYYSGKTVVKANIWSGWEETYQAWNGVPSVRLRNDLAGMKRYEEHGLYSAKETAEMIASNHRTYNLYTYDNQVDHYQQDHYHFHLSHRFNSRLHFNLATYYTYGRGYYEQFKYSQKFGSYGLQKPVINGIEISRTDLVRRKWLDNDFYGTVFSVLWKGTKTDFTCGGGWNRYSGRHFGRLVWTEYAVKILPDYEWYRNKGEKTDLNGYAKINYSLSPVINLFADLQYRTIRYEIAGKDDDLRLLDQQHDYHFFNPKAGIFYQPDASNSLYLSIARSNREPNRDNFTDTPPGGMLPEHESLNDWETGWNYRSVSFTISANLFAMLYHNQLALTGQINDVGAAIMTNVEKSYRTGLEVQWGVRLLPPLHWDGNMTFSRNRIAGFTEYVDDWDSGEQRSDDLGTTHLSFSPGLIANSRISWSPGRLSLKLISSYTGKQYIDNSSSDERKLDAWLVNSLIVDYRLKIKSLKTVSLQLMVNNLFDAEYESNAWVYSYYYGGKRYKMDGYFPQAGRNFMAGVTIDL